MTPLDSHTYIVDRQPGGLVFTLPPRDMSQYRAAAWWMLGIGVIICLFMVGWMAGSLMPGVGMLLRGNWFGLLLVGFSLLGLGGLLPGLGMVVVGLGGLAGRSRAVLRVGGENLSATEYIGPLHWTWRRLIAQIDELRIEHADKDQRNGPASLRELIAIVADGPKKLVIAPAYDRAILEPLADELADAINTARGADATGKRFADGNSDRAAIKVVAPEEAADRAVPQPPASNALVERRNGGLTIQLPPLGVWKGSKGMFTFSLLWNAFMVVFTSIMLFGAGSANVSVWPGLLMLGGFLTLFWAIGIGLLVASINAGRRRAIIDVIGDTLLVSQQSLFKQQQREWQAAELRTIEVGDSNVSQNDVPLRELHLHLAAGKRVDMFRERTDDELEWIADQLRRTLSLPREPLSKPG